MSAKENLIVFSPGSAGFQPAFNLLKHVFNTRGPGSLLKVVLVVLSIFRFSCPPSYAFDQTHKLFTTGLKKYAKPNGVAYAKWKKNRAGLDSYFKDLETLTAEEYEKFNALQKKSLWLNVYNALAIRLVIDNYPIDGNNAGYPRNSFRQIPNVWKAASCTVAGKKDVSLYVIFHSMMRKDVHDSRTHFAIVPASRGAYPLQAEAFQESKVDEQLATIARKFMDNPENLSADLSTGTIYVSHIFKWFPLDFMESSDGKPQAFPPPADDQVVRDYVLKFLPVDQQEKLRSLPVRIVYRSYDWALNDTAAAKSGNELKDQSQLKDQAQVENSAPVILSK